MDAREASLGRYLRCLGPFLVPCWRLFLLFFLLTALHALGSFSRALLAKPFLEKVFAPGATGTAAAPAQPSARDARVLQWLPESLARKRWVRVLASLTEREAHVPGVDVREYFRFICFVAMVLAVLLGVSTFGKLYVSRRLVNVVTLALRNYAYERLLRQDVGFFDRQRAGDLLARVTADLDLARRALMEFMIGLVDKPLYIVIGVVTCLALSWKLSLLCFVGLPVILLPIAVLARKIRRGAHARQERLGDLTDAMVETFAGMRVIRAFQLESLEAEAFRRKNRQFFRKDMSVARARALSRAGTEFLVTFGLALLLLLVGGLVLAGRHEGLVALGNVVPFFLTLAVMYQPLKLLVRSYNTFQESAVGAQRLFQVLDRAPTVVERPGAVPLRGVREGIVLERVSFRYDRDEVLHEVSFRIRAGETVALVGPSGAGKSTILDLLARFYDVTEGAIKIDGRDLRDYTLESLYRHTALVQQEPFLFNTTIRENIRMGRPEATDAEVEAAARAAGVASFAAELPAGYDTLCGERGAALSGGERQRVAIARALLKNAPILLLDEATSSLDSQAEREVQAALERLMAGRTTVVIAHRLSTVRRAHRIVVLDRGRVVETGTHAELLRRGGLYARLYHLQFHDSGRPAALSASSPPA